MSIQTSGSCVVLPCTSWETHYLPFNSLGMQIAFVLPFSMLLLAPVGYHRVRFSLRLRMFMAVAGIMIGLGVVIAHYFSGMFSLGAWCGGIVLFVFAWIGRSIALQDRRPGDLRPREK